MGKPKKKGTYEHFCVLIFAQGTWNEKDRDAIRKSLIDRHNMKSDKPHHLYNKLIRRDEKPSYCDCNICGPIYGMFKEIQGKNDGILYQSHHYIILEDDMDDMKGFANLILSNNKVKKLYILYLDGFGEIDRTTIKTWQLKDIKEHIKGNKLKLTEFDLIIDEKQFVNRTLYEIYKSY